MQLINKFKPIIGIVVAGTILTACNSLPHSVSEKKVEVTSLSVIDTYILIAENNYQDSLLTVKALDTTIDIFLTAPSEETLAKTKQAWIAARVPYQQTEVYRFGNESVDNWEGKVNAWPLDEGLIDYVDANYGEESDENPFYKANIIANPAPTIGGKIVDAKSISKSFLRETLHEIDEVESNVATGYHAIEFLLWGQDLNGTNPGAGERPATDFSLTECTGGNCDRRRAYLKSATLLLIDDLQEMANSWKAEGESRLALQAKGDKAGLETMLTGMGSLAYGELAGERMKLGLMLHDPEEEHDCFSDNTHWSHYYDAKGIKNIYLGEYLTVQGNLVSGKSLSDLVQKILPELDDEMKAKLLATESAMQLMVDQALVGNTFDVLIGKGNTHGNQLIKDIVDALVDQARTTEKIIHTLALGDIKLQGSESLDKPNSVLN
ncbi:MAG: putative iron-regulated protein [Pseudohongiellaceae bacterium]|jgi:putative iron-regulated protein